jgi:hypothetical protein
MRDRDWKAKAERQPGPACFLPPLNELIVRREYV